MEKVKHAQINEAILDANHVLILPDERIDGDSLGAALALYRYLDRSYKKVTILCSAEIPEKYHYLPHIELCRFDRVVLIDESIDLVISVDCSDADYISEIVGALPRPVDLINIDHHETNDRFGEIVQVVTEAASTTEVVYRFFRENNLWIDPDMATALLAGVYFDTTVFFEQIYSGRIADDCLRINFARRPSKRCSQVSTHQQVTRHAENLGSGAWSLTSSFEWGSSNLDYGGRYG